MRKKSAWILAFLGALVVLVGAVLILRAALREAPAEWTTNSPKALEAYERGVESLEKLYWSEAASHFEHAIELDDDFAAAKLHLLLIESGTPEQREQWFRDLSETDLEALRPRERFLIGYWRARFSGDGEAAQEILDGYLEAAPEDPWALSIECERTWERETWDAAEACYSRLIEMHPNWVQAQNRLGLIAMARGHFAESEEHFRTYRYIAPDQAAPWDSLGQLLMTRGRYDQAEDAFARALEIKPDYCYAVWHLASLETLRRRFAASEERLRQLEDVAACDDYVRWGMVCHQRAWNAYLEGDLERARSKMDAGCLEQRRGFDFVAHRLALAAEDYDAARRLEGTLEARLEKKRESGDVYLFYENFLRAVGQHLVAMRLWSQNAGARPSEACDLLAQADESLLYWGADRAAFKLFNLRQLAACRAAAGEEAGAAEARAALEKVHPGYIEEDRVPELPGIERAGTRSGGEARP